MKRTSLTQAECPVARSLDAIGDWWSLLIVRDAFDGISRFGEFRRSLGIAKGMLTARLRDLVECGVLETAPASDGSAYHDYLLTEKGRALFPVVVALRQWGQGAALRAWRSAFRTGGRAYRQPGGKAGIALSRWQAGGMERDPRQEAVILVRTNNQTDCALQSV